MDTISHGQFTLLYLLGVLFVLFLTSLGYWFVTDNSPSLKDILYAGFKFTIKIVLFLTGFALSVRMIAFLWYWLREVYFW
jgi:hypothetical protein